MSAGGSDRANGLSVRKAWRTVARVDRARLRPGDRVLFRGGDTFAGASLTPRSSGKSGSPIRYGSYGGGRAMITAPDAAIFLENGVSHLVFSNLQLSTGGVGLSSIVKDAASGPPVTDVAIVGCRLANTGGPAVISNQHSDVGWQIVDDVIQHTGDSGLILFGAHAVVRGNVITDVGWNDAIPWHKHGIYLKGAYATIASNRISAFSDNGISLRSTGATVVGNTITGGQTGIGYFSYDPDPGRSIVSGNTITGSTTAAFYYDGHTWAGGTYPVESFALTSNRLVPAAGAIGVDVRYADHVSIALKNNLFGGSYRFAFIAVPPVVGTFSESSNRFTGPSWVAWNGYAMSVQQYQAQSGQGLHDVAPGP